MPFVAHHFRVIEVQNSLVWDLSILIVELEAKASAKRMAPMLTPGITGDMTLAEG
jgi:hypothetical protein